MHQHQQNPPVLNWRFWLMQVNLYSGRKTVIVVLMNFIILSQVISDSPVITVFTVIMLWWKMWWNGLIVSCRCTSFEPKLNRVWILQFRYNIVHHRRVCIILAADRSWLQRSASRSDVSLGAVRGLTREKYRLWAAVVEPTSGFTLMLQKHLLFYWHFYNKSLTWWSSYSVVRLM